MSIEQSKNVQRSLANFLEQAVIHVVVPDNPQFDLGEFLNTDIKQKLETEQSFEKSVIWRHNLYIGEMTNVVVVLKIEYENAATIKAQLGAFTMVLETFMLEKEHHEGQQTATRSLLKSTNVDIVRDPLIAVEKALAHSANREPKYVYVAWTLNVQLDYYNLKQVKSSAAIFYTITLNVKESGMIHQNQVHEEYLPSGVPGSINLLAAYRNDPHFSKKPPYLLASRLSKFGAPNVENEGQQGKSRTASSQLYCLMSAVTHVVKVFPIGVSLMQMELFVSVDMEVSRHVENYVVFESLELSVTKGRAEILQPSGLLLPLRCHPGDSLSFIYKLQPNHSQEPSTADPQEYILSFNFLASLHRNRAIVIPIKLIWSTPVDLSAILRSVTASTHPSAVLSTNPNPAVIPTLTQLITLTITSAPSVAVGSVLRWFVLLTNRSTTRTLRLALVPITEYTSLNVPISSEVTTKKKDSSFGLPSTIPPLSYFAPAGPLQNPKAVVATTTIASSVAKLTALTPSTYIGPLPPGTSATAEIRFLVLGPGTGGVKLVRIVDLEADGERKVGETKGEGLRWIDLGPRWLPDIVILEEN